MKNSISRNKNKKILKILDYAWMIIIVLLGISFNKNAFAAANMDDFWNGNAVFSLQNRYSFPTYSVDNQNAWRSMNMNSTVIVVGNNWYQFYREYYISKPSYCSNDYSRLVSRMSTDNGITWSSPISVVTPVENGPNECASLDGDVYYDNETFTWHYLFQCANRDGIWKGCHASLSSENPMQEFVLDNHNPVIENGSLWNFIYPGHNIFDEGTFDIVEKVGEYFFVTFHGFDGVNGFRGLIKTKNFYEWEIVNNYPIFSKENSDSWNVEWLGGINGESGSVGGGAANIIKEGAYYYEIIEAADRSLSCTVGQNWVFGLMRASSLSEKNWETLPNNGNPIVKDLGNISKRICGIQYPYLFKDKDDNIYLLFFRVASTDTLFRDNDLLTGYYLYKLVNKTFYTEYSFEEGFDHEFILSNTINNKGVLDGKLSNIMWTEGSQENKKAAMFNGNNSKIIFENNNIFNIASDLNIKIRAKINEFPTNGSALLAGKIWSYWIELYPNNRICFYIRNNQSNNSVCYEGNNLVNNWVDITGKYNIENSEINLKIGDNNISSTASPGGIINANNNPFILGGDENSSIENYYKSFNGLVEYMILNNEVIVSPPAGLSVI